MSAQENKVVTQRLDLGYPRKGTTRRDFIKAAGVMTFAAFIAGSELLKPGLADADSAVQRPISDFLSAQGTTAVFTAPVPDQLGWIPPFPAATPPPPVPFALVDYAGLAAAYLSNHGVSLGTTMAGNVTERPLADGSAQVTVILDTTNALTWVSQLDLTFPPGKDLATQLHDPGLLLFGFHAQDIVVDPTDQPGLGASHLHVVVYNTAPGAPLPDLVNPLPGQVLTFLAFHASATGPLHALAGLGPDGTPGRAIVSQTGLLLKGPFQHHGAMPDMFPVESVQLRAIGK